MAPFQNTLSTALRRNELVYGTFMMLNSAWTARTVAGCGWDVSATPWLAQVHER